MSISTEESISILIEIYKECCPDEIVHFKQEIANGNGEWLIDSCLNDYKIKSEEINLKLYQSGRIGWLLSYLLNYHHTVLIDYFLSKIDKEKNKKGVNTTYSLENLFSVLLKSGNLRIDELEKLLDKKTREDIVYGFRGSTEYLRYTIEKSKKKLDKSSEKPEIKLLKSLIKELKDKQKFESLGKDKIASPIFPTKYNKPQLKSIYEKSKIEFIKCSEADFLYWFAGIGESGRKIKWKKMWGKKPNKAALYWYCKQMNPKVEPGMINSVFDIEVHKKYDTANEHSFPEINSIFNNL
jgi:hypothetical protein